MVRRISYKLSNGFIFSNIFIKGRYLSTEKLKFRQKHWLIVENSDVPKLDTSTSEMSFNTSTN